MEKQPKELAAAGEDLISKLPVDILHLVLRRIPFSKETVQTAALSRQWGNLWRSYPVVEFNSSSEEDDCYLSDSYQKIIEGFKDFSDATIERFSRDEQLRMETLKISLITFSYDLSSLAVEQLLDLACKRKAEYVTVKVVCSVCLPLGLLTSSSANAKTLHFQGIRFMLNKNIDCDPLLCLNFLRSLILDNVDLYGGDRLLTNLIASSPLLDTLKLLDVEGIRKLSMSNVPNLKSLEIASCGDLVEIEIAAPGLQNMLIKQALYDDRHVLELIAPQLNILEIVHCDRSTLGTISKLEFLKSLKLSRPRGDLPLLPRSLRFLWLTGLELTEEQVLLNLIAGSPFLETLELVSILKLRKLQVVNLANLKTLNIMYCFSLEEIEIAAFELQSLCIHGSDYIEMNLSKIELIAPELNALELIYSGLKVDDLECLVSKLPSLKSLSLDGFSPPTEKKLKLLGHKLEEIKLAGLAGLEEIEIELDVVPRLEKFVLECNELADQIKKCEITNSAASCQWEVDFRMRFDYVYSDSGRSWFVEFNSFLARFPKFQTVNVYFEPISQLPFIREEADCICTTSPKAIQHLSIRPNYTTRVLARDLLKNLFGACHPRLFTIRNRFRYCQENLFEVFLSHYLQDSDATDANMTNSNGYVDWRHQLKSVTILREDANYYVVEKAKGLAAIRDDLSVLLKTKDIVRLMLAWC